MNEQQVINHIWSAFDKAIAEQFLSDGCLPHQEHLLSRQLAVFFKQATSPKVQAMNMLATHRLFNQRNCCYETECSKDGVVINCQPLTDWFAMKVTIGGFGMSVNVFAESRVVWCEGISFNRADLEDNADYDSLLQRLIKDGVDVCQSLETAIKNTLKAY